MIISICDHEEKSKSVQIARHSGCERQISRSKVSVVKTASTSLKLNKLIAFNAVNTHLAREHEIVFGHYAETYRPQRYNVKFAILAQQVILYPSDTRRNL